MDVSGERRGVIATKCDGTASCSMAGIALGEDAGGYWLGLEAGWMMERATRTLRVPYCCVLYVPRNRGYLARFSDANSDARAPLYVDITTIPERSRDRFGYPDEIVPGARAELDAVMGLIVSDEEPFGTKAAGFLQRSSPSSWLPHRQHVHTVERPKLPGQGAFSADHRAGLSPRCLLARLPMLL